MFTDEQIQQLFLFCEKHFVREYDVQIELVDHLANAIEEKMSNNKNLSFEKAVEEVHAGFGVLGFAGIVNSRTRALNNQLFKMKKRLFLSYFSWPKAGVTACLFLGLIFIGNLLSAEAVDYVMTAICISLYVFYIFVIAQAGYNIKKQKRKLLLTDVGYNQSVLIMFAGGFLGERIPYDHLFRNEHKAIVYGTYLVFVAVTVLLFLGILSYKKLLENILAAARKQYPEAFELST